MDDIEVTVWVDLFLARHHNSTRERLVAVTDSIVLLCIYDKYKVCSISGVKNLR